MARKWVVATKRKNFSPTTSSNLCCKHFTADDYQLRPNASYPLLRDDAVPSVFPQRPPKRKRKRLVKAQAAASSSKDAEVREHEAHLDAHVEDEPLINVPSGAEFESIVIKQEPIFGEEETPEPWAAHDPIEIPVKCETADPIQGEPPVPLDLEEDDLLYFKSLVPDLVKLTPELKDVFRMKVRNILKELTT
uniref:THAP domain-containing protein 1 n=1 Tax=Lygus hesperus TaxID=30085 RepID=A0A146LZM3_LYGHE